MIIFGDSEIFLFERADVSLELVVINADIDVDEACVNANYVALFYRLRFGNARRGLFRKGALG